MTRYNRGISRIAALTAACAVPVVLAACSGGGAGTGAAAGGSTAGVNATDTAKEFSVLLTTENSQTPAIFKALAAGACKAQNDALPLKIDQTPTPTSSRRSSCWRDRTSCR